METQMQMTRAKRQHVWAAYLNFDCILPFCSIYVWFFNKHIFVLVLENLLFTKPRLELYTTSSSAPSWSITSLHRRTHLNLVLAQLNANMIPGSGTSTLFFSFFKLILQFSAVYQTCTFAPSFFNHWSLVRISI